MAGKIWVEKQEELLKEGRDTDVTQNIVDLSGNNEKAQNIIDYYQGNIQRMDYSKYKK